MQAGQGIGTLRPISLWRVSIKDIALVEKGINLQWLEDNFFYIK